MPSLRLSRPLRVPAVLAALAAPVHGAAQIATDRPDFVESSATVGRGALQVEASVAFDAAGSHPSRTAAWSIPTLLRLGVSTHVELRLESELWVRDASSAALAGESGLADVSVGAKWHVVDQAGARPSAALLVHADLPSGSDGLRAEGVGTSLRAVAEWTLPRGFALGVMPGVASVAAGGGRHVAGILGAVVGKELTPSLRAFTEVAFEQLAGDPLGGHVGTLNGGLAWLAGAATQLDLAFSVGVTSAAPDVAFTLGWSRRFPFA
ncbi:MAG: hypothetical protein AMXMBFR53_42540 [Gemmatimonadota bacterium]